MKNKGKNKWGGYKRNKTVKVDIVKPPPKRMAGVKKNIRKAKKQEDHFKNHINPKKDAKDIPTLDFSGIDLEDIFGNIEDKELKKAVIRYAKKIHNAAQLYYLFPTYNRKLPPGTHPNEMPSDDKPGEEQEKLVAIIYKMAMLRFTKDVMLYCGVFNESNIDEIMDRFTRKAFDLDPKQMIHVAPQVNQAPPPKTDINVKPNINITNEIKPEKKNDNLHEHKKLAKDILGGNK